MSADCRSVSFPGSSAGIVFLILSTRSASVCVFQSPMKSSPTSGGAMSPPSVAP